MALVRELSRRTGRAAEEQEVRAALTGLGAQEIAALRRALRGAPPARPLGPSAWVDVARGVEPQVAAAREVSGYYALLAERDALASMLQARTPEPPRKRAKASQDLPAVAPLRSPPTRPPRARPVELKPRGPRPAPPGLGAPAKAPRATADEDARAAHLLGLFAYHRDSTGVAQALRISLAELNAEVDLLKLRRKVARLVRGFDVDLPAATPLSAARSGPPMRRRAASKAEAPSAAAPPLGHELKKLLAEVGPRRRALAARLGPPDEPLSDKQLLALLAQARLERDFANAERELLRELFLTHRGARGRVAADLGLTDAQLQDLIVERGQARELDGVREKFRREARDKKWPEGRIELLLRERPHLQELGLLAELEREVKTRVQLLWKSLKSRPHPLEDLARELRISSDDVKTLQRLCELRR